MEKHSFNAPPPHGSDIPIVQRAHDFFLDFHKNVVKFPKAEKHTLGQSVSLCTLALLELLLGASKSPSGEKKNEMLKEASNKLELLKLLIRICFEIKAISDKQYLILEANLQEIGKMLGGWLRSINR